MSINEEKGEEFEKMRYRLRAKSLSATSFGGCLMGLILLGAGCGSGAVKPTSEQLKAFDDAPAAVKQVWKKALMAEKSKDYLAAQNSLKNLRKMDLTSEQRQALNAKFFAFQQRLYQAAEQGDPAAVKAVKEINSHYKR